MQIRKYTLAEVKELISARGMKATQQRIVIYEALMKLYNHPTAEQIYDVIHHRNPSISLATVYKTLDALVEVGLAEKVLSDNGQMRYEGNLEEHNHIYCTNTQEIVDFDDPELIAMVRAYFQSRKVSNLKINSIRLQINGEKINPKENVTIV